MPPTDLTAVAEGPLVAQPAVLCDLDGCLIAGGQALPGAAALAAACGPRLWIVSNNSTDTAESLSRRLARLGLAAPPERIVLAGEETLRALARTRPGARVALFAGPLLGDLALRLGFVLTDERPEAVVLARDPDFSMTRLSRLARLAHAGIPLHVTNPDPSHPGLDGAPAPETGALLAALAAITPPRAIACLGKPAPDLLRIALARAGVGPEAAVFLGDTPETDGAAAAAAGVPFVLIARPGATAAAGRFADAASC